MKLKELLKKIDDREMLNIYNKERLHRQNGTGKCKKVFKHIITGKRGRRDTNVWRRN
jgi:hypothetical protein